MNPNLKAQIVEALEEMDAICKHLPGKQSVMAVYRALTRLSELEPIVQALNARKRTLTDKEFGNKELSDLGASCYDTMNQIDALAANRIAKIGEDE